jgi:hypothetical protein
MCDIIVMNARAPTEDESGDSKDSFFEELEQVFDNFLKYRKNSVRFHKKVGRELYYLFIER